MSVFKEFIRAGHVFGEVKNGGEHVEAIGADSRMMGGIKGSFGADKPQASERPAKAYTFVEIRLSDSNAARSHQQSERCQSRNAAQHSALAGLSGYPQWEATTGNRLPQFFASVGPAAATLR